MATVVLTALIETEGVEAEMSLDGRAQEFAKNVLDDLLRQGTIAWAKVNKIPEHAGESVQ